MHENDTAPSTLGSSPLRLRWAPAACLLAIGVACGGDPTAGGDADSGADALADGAPSDAAAPPDSGTAPGGELGFCPLVPSDPAATRCQSDDDCDPTTRCFPPEPLYDSTCETGVRECDIDDDCEGRESGTICGEFPLALNACGHPPAFVCVVPCAVSGCAADETCVEGRVCWPTPCSDGFPCAVNHICPEASRAERFRFRDHGCARRLCDTSADCDCGTCWFTDSVRDADGACFDEPGSCQQP